jgi:Polyketide cyclase / dehydrase and lipid transport
MKTRESNHHFSYTVTIQSSREQVWNQLIDVASWKDWDTELKHAELQGAFATGTRGLMQPLQGPKLTFYLTAVEPQLSYTFRTKLPIGWLVIKRTLSQYGQLTEFCDDIAFTGILKHVFGFFLGRKFRSVLPEVMNRFKVLVETK